MTIAAADFRNCVIAPALAALARDGGIPPSRTAADLLMATAAVESALGTWLTQVTGPAKSVFQIEPETLARTLVAASQGQYRALQAIMSTQPVIDQIDGNLVLAAAVARLIYWQVPAPLPPHTEVGLWEYYKAYWNTPAGKTTEAQFLAALRLTDIVF
jgi:hypothetical protein